MGCEAVAARIVRSHIHSCCRTTAAMHGNIAVVCFQGAEKMTFLVDLSRGYVRTKRERMRRSFVANRQHLHSTFDQITAIG